MGKVVLLTGGGVKSAVAAARYAPDSHLYFAHVDYGQASAARERAASETISTAFPGSSFVALSVPHLARIAGWGVTPAPSGESAEARSAGSASTAGVSAAWMRRCIMPQLLLTGWQCATRIGAGVVVVGLCRSWTSPRLGGSDGTTSRDVRRELLYAMNLVFESGGSTGAVRLEAPLADVGPGDIIRLGGRWSVPLGATWSCDEAGDEPCRSCPGCQARAEAFRFAGVVDARVAGHGGEASAARDAVRGLRAKQGITQG